MTKPQKPVKNTRYQEVADELRAEIASATYKIGQCLPTEHELCQRFSASRFTVRKAIDVLRDLGLLESRSGYGTFVVSLRPQEKVVQTLSSFEELLQYPAETYRKQIEAKTITASPELALLLQASAGQEWVWLQAMRLAVHSEAAISWLEAYIAPELADVVELPNPSGASLLRQIQDTHDVHAANAQVEVFVTTINDKLALPLKVQQGVPALGIVRRYRNENGHVYLVTHSIHPENRFRLNFELERQN